MSAESGWLASEAARQAPQERRAELATENESVEVLLRRLITRVEESERRYSEALGELQTRLDQLSKSTDTISPLADSEEAETLERLRSQLSGLAERFEHPEPADLAPRFEGFAKLDKVLSEAREESAGIGRQHTPFDGLEKGLSPSPTFQFRADPLAVQAAAITPDTLDLDRRFMDLADRLERSINAAMPTAAIQSINARMDEIARSFDEALKVTPKLENLRSLEQQIVDMGQQLGTIGAQASRINAVEDQLSRLLEKAEDSTFQIEMAVGKAANEAARIVAGPGSAAERLDALHREIVAMNEETRATDNRLVDTLAAMHDSLRTLIEQVGRIRQANHSQPSLPYPRSAVGALGEPVEQDSAPASAEPLREPAKAESPSLRERLMVANRGRSKEESPVFARSTEEIIEDAPLDLDESDASIEETAFPAVDSSMSGEDLVAAARRAAQAAAARTRARTDNPAKAKDHLWEAPASSEMPERRKRSLLMIAAVLLLLLSAGLLYSRLKSKHEAAPTAPSAEQSVTPPEAPAVAAPSAEAAPGPQTPATQAAPSPAPMGASTSPEMPQTPVTVIPDSGSAPAAEGSAPAMPAPSAPHPTTPSSSTQESDVPAAVRVSEAPPVFVSSATAPGVSDVAKSSAIPQAQPATYKSDDLPADATMSVAEPQLPQSASAEQGPGPSALRQAANDGDPRAQYVLALYLSESDASAGTAPNLSEAARWLALSASKSLAPAQYRLAVLYERGDGVAKDLGRAKSWYLRAAEQGNIKAMHNLAVVVSRESNNADYALAAKWFGEAASYGLADSQFNLGVLTEHGLGVARNEMKAYEWFSLAAQSRDAGAIKHRDQLKARLSVAERAQADAAVKAWAPKPALIDANEVAWQAAWRIEASGPTTSEILRAQALLNKLGYDAGTANGKMGAKTADAIRAFELRTGMDETGEVSNALLSRLERLAS